MILLTVGSILTALPVVQVASAQGSFVVNVGVQDEMKTRNLIRGTFFGTDVWTADALGPVVEGSAQVDYQRIVPLPYTMLGTDRNGNGKFDTSEIGVFSNVTGIAGREDEWIAFFNITGMKWTDGTLVEMEDVLFGYHLAALAPAVTSSRFLKDRAGEAGSNYTVTRYQFVNPTAIAGAAADGWLGKPVANVRYQFAIKLLQTGPNARFFFDTLQATFMPAYFWQGTGVRKLNGAIVETNVHPDFGWAMNPDPQAGPYLNGVPAAGTVTTQPVTFEGIDIPGGTLLKGYDVVSASVGCPAGNPSCASPWDAQDRDVIGAGPFKFGTWEQGVFARLDRNPDYFLPNPAEAQVTFAYGLQRAEVQSIVYRLFRNVQASVFALQAGELDFVDWNVPPEYVGTLSADPNVGVLTSADAGFFYVGYNFRRRPFGYLDPAAGSTLPGNDVGKPFRMAVEHATDKRSIVTSLLQNLGVPGHTVVNPAVQVYYNASATRREFDLSLAASILNDAAQDPFYSNAGYGTDPTGDCVAAGSGCRTLPGIGTGLITMLTPQADYDPIRAAAGDQIETNMRSIGVNLDSRPTAFGRITDALDQRDFDMWMLGWSIGNPIPPDYMEAFFHSRTAPFPGQNYGGYVNTSFDDIIDSAIGASDPAESVRLWKWTQGVIEEDGAYNVLFFRRNVWAFRQDRVDASIWQTNPGGDIWNYWSRILLAPAPPGLLRSAATAPSALASGDTSPIAITVRDPDGNLVADAAVTITVTTGLGQVTNPSGTTNAQGQFSTIFRAPTLAPGAAADTTFLTVEAERAPFGSAFIVTVVITTFAPGVPFLNLLLEQPFGNAVNEGGVSVIDITISDETGLPASGANVILTPTPTATLSPSSFTTDATGHRQVTFTAPAVTDDTLYRITINADKGQVSGNSTVTLTVLDVPPPPAPPPDYTLVGIVGAAVATGAAGGAYVGLRRRKAKRK